MLDIANSECDAPREAGTEGGESFCQAGWLAGGLEDADCAEEEEALKEGSKLHWTVDEPQ